MTGMDVTVNGGEKKDHDVLDVNLYSRQIYALGQTAMVRLRSARVLITGMGSVGVEAAKNLVLGGVRHVTIHDSKQTTYNDLSAQFYLHEEDLGKNRAEACFQKIEELNDSVTCTLNTDSLTEEFVKGFDVVFTSDLTFEQQIQVNQWTRSSNILFISADTAGLFGYVFNDLGKTFVIEDVDGEQSKEIWLEFINTANGDVSTLEGGLHGFQDGDYVEFLEVNGCEELKGHAPIKITVKSKSVFNIGDVAKTLSPYVEGGIARQVKMPVEAHYKTLEESIAEPNFLTWDFMKFDSSSQLHVLFQALYKFVKINGRRPAAFDRNDLANFVQLLPNGHDIPDETVSVFCFTSSGNLQPNASVLGGIAAQEVMKAITHITSPQNGFLYVDNIEALPHNVQKSLSEVDQKNFEPRGTRYDAQAAVFGWDFIEKIHNFSLFVVGAGAIGCELLKNFAMMGVATNSAAKVKITDMDQIEVSNLNRQFLFRRADVGKKKSECAASAVKKFNNDLNIAALSERVAEDTEAIFNDDFFSKLDCVTNALDNIDARRYMDRRCIYYRLPLLESGTMGTKGNTQVVYPHLTESYGSTNDPPEKDTPICTLKNFPYEIQHTIQWGRDIFVGLFTNPAETANQFLLDERGFIEHVDQMAAGQRIAVLKTVKRCLIDERPGSAEECVQWARELFQKYYHNQIAQLLHNFPEDQLTSQGMKFWSGTKRCPHVVDFDPNNPTHFDFVYSAAFLRAFQYGLKPIVDKKQFLEVVAKFTPPPFVPQSGVKIAVTDEEAQAQDAEGAEDDTDEIVTSLKVALARLGNRNPLVPIDFEKDDDTNHHMEFVTSCSNLRASNYNIAPAEFMQTKQIAGRIIPALATTTSVVAGLVAIELYKVIDMKNNKDAVISERFKCGFANLALPLYAFSEPVGAPKRKYSDTEFTLWDRIEIDGPMTLQQLIDKIAEITGLEISMMSSGVSLLYAFFQGPKARERLKFDVVRAVEEVSHNPVPPYRRSIVLEVAATNANDEDVEVPYIKYNFK
ncbi:hypothetical protein FO519_005683 [Halicephalobus sp. NKZ332]|nr:hypothetical protein FO519_005683 [Halicephalobus sp. NKZ332]